jgi:aminoglycoside phosphotransferase (APT) family kinase protein
MSVAQQISTPDTEKERKVIAWIEKNVGGTVERCEQQPRWRGGWWVDVRRAGEAKKLYVREERKEDYPPWPLEHEAGILQLLEKHGVPVPHVYGICEDPHATVMDCLPGQQNFATIKDESERLSVLNHFAEVVAKMHSIPPQELVKLGVKMPQTAEEISLGCFKLCEEMYLKGKKRPDPRVEFLRRWIYNNIPKHRKKVSVVAVDSGQFLFEKGKVTGLYDFEYGCLGDPMIDLAFMPLRLSMENVGDMKPFFERYTELTGDKPQLEVLTFHAIWWGLCTPFILTADLHSPPAHSTYFEYIGWYIGSMLAAFEVLADMKGLKLDTKYQAKATQPSRWAQIFDVMAAKLPPPAENEPYALQEQRKFMEFARRVDAHRDLEDEYLKGVERLLGRPMDDWRQADKELEKFVLNAGPEHDEALITLFHRWALAQAVTLIDGLAYLPMLYNPFQRFSEIAPRTNS